MASAKPAQARKSKAASALRELAAELSIDSRGRNYDLSNADFRSVYASVVAKCQTPEQTNRAQKARSLYEGTADDDAFVSLPAVPALPSYDTGGIGSTFVQNGREKEFRLRGTSCLFSYNSPSFVHVGPRALWIEFLVLGGRQDACASIRRV